MVLEDLSWSRFWPSGSPALPPACGRSHPAPSPPPHRTPRPEPRGQISLGPGTLGSEAPGAEGEFLPPVEGKNLTLAWRLRFKRQVAFCFSFLHCLLLKLTCYVTPSPALEKLGLSLFLQKAVVVDFT